MFGSRRAPLFNRVDQTQLGDFGRSSFRKILMQAMREDASWIVIQPREGQPPLVHAVMKFRLDAPINTLSPGLDELIAHLAALPDESLRLNLGALVDDFVAEYEPCNNLAREQIAWYRAAPRKDYEAFVEVDEAERKATIRLKLVKSPSNSC